MRPFFFLPILFGLIAGCGGTEVQPATPKTNVPPPPPAEPQPKEAIARSAVTSAIKGGLGRFPGCEVMPLIKRVAAAVGAGRSQRARLARAAAAPTSAPAR